MAKNILICDDAALNYMSQILVELVKLANLIINISKSLACANRINGIFAEQSSIVEKPESSRIFAVKENNSQEQKKEGNTRETDGDRKQKTCLLAQ